jgi:phage regulator Rha-like protein
MSDMIKVKNKEYFIDSEGLAILSENEHRAVTQLIRNYKSDLEESGVLTFKMSKPTEAGGRPKKTWILSEHQAMVLTTFMKNTKKVKEFKVRLVSEFIKMRNYIQKMDTIRLAGIETRKSLTDTIQESGEQERMHGHGYSTYTNMVYEVCGLSKSFKDYKKWITNEPQRNSIEFRSWLNPDELKRVELAEAMIKPLLELDKQYSEIKETLKPLFERKGLS